MPHAIRIHQNGGPEVMRFEEVELGAPARRSAAAPQRDRHQFLRRERAARRVLFRQGAAVPTLALGNEAAGVIEALGADVNGFSVSERVAYAGMRGEFFEDTGATRRRATSRPSGC